MPIYCDESGNTGYNLLEEKQPFFVYAALNIEEDEAIKFVDYLKNKYHLQGEPKGANWIRSNNGKKAIVELYEKYASNVKIVFHHKKYALACKYFEYVFEPTISNLNQAFYRFKFHKFIASLVFAAFESNENKAEDLFWNFQELLRGNNSTALFNLLSSQTTPNDLTSMVAEFTTLHRSTILEEITTEDGYNYWVLDLAQTALHDLLCLWSKEKGPLKVVVDESQPLKEAMERNNLLSQVGAPISFWDPFDTGEKIPANFSLLEPALLTSSKKSKGLQMADLFASSYYWQLMNPKDSFSNTLRDHSSKFIPSPHTYCIVPELDLYLALDSMEYSFGVVTLTRLLQFSRESIHGIAEKFLDFLEEKIKKINESNI